jgi:hypothetical protein
MKRLMRSRVELSGSRSRLGFPVVLAVLIAALLIVPAAAAFLDYQSVTVYASNDTLGPGGYYQTAGWNTRTDNAGCRVANSGQMSVSYYDTNMNRVTYSGTVWTNCSTSSLVIIYNNGYYRSRCTHEGTVTFNVNCDSWNYVP